MKSDLQEIAWMPFTEWGSCRWLSDSNLSEFCHNLSRSNIRIKTIKIQHILKTTHYMDNTLSSINVVSFLNSFGWFIIFCFVLWHIVNCTLKASNDGRKLWKAFCATLPHDKVPFIKVNTDSSYPLHSHGEWWYLICSWEYSVFGK